MFEMKGKYTTAKVMIDQIENTCYKQIGDFINHPVFTNPIAIMPDTHAGMGAVIGFTMEITDKIIPNVIGVDIGCGMYSGRLARKITVDLKKLDRRIREEIPMGMNVYKSPIFKMKDFPFSDIITKAGVFAGVYKKKFGIDIDKYIPEYSYEWFEKHMKEIGMDFGRAETSIGTLGGGNHFIEIGLDEQKNCWITIHSGSRNLGLKIAKYWQNETKDKVTEEMKIAYSKAIDKIKLNAVTKEQRKQIPQKIKEARAKHLKVEKVSKALDYLENEKAYGYLFDMIFAQEYASLNRKKMMKIIIKLAGGKINKKIETVHNFIDFSDLIIRKGAIKSYEGSEMIIPFNMRDGILVCEGKGNKEWNSSAPHGAGRLMSRTQAKNELDLQKFSDEMKDICSSSVCEETLDEAPGAYKDSKVIEAAIEPTVKIINRIKPILNIKALE